MSGCHLFKLERVPRIESLLRKLRAETKARFYIVGEIKQLSN